MSWFLKGHFVTIVWISYSAQILPDDDLELPTLLPPRLESWGYKHVLACEVSGVHALY